MSATSTSLPPLPATARYKNPIFGFEFDYPKAWKLTEDPGTNATRLIVLAGEDGPTYMSPDWCWVAVAVFDREASQAFSDSNDATQIAMGMANTDDGLIFQQPISQTVSGYPAVRVAHEEEYEGKKTIQMQLYVVTDAYLFAVSGEAPKDKWEEHEAVLESFVSSFGVVAP